MLIRVAFVNQGLIAESQNIDKLISDCYPAMGAWFDDGALEVVFSNNVLWHAVKEKLAGRALKIKIRVSLPRILHSMYDDALKFRRTLLDANSEQTLYLELKRHEPYITLVKKWKENGRTHRENVRIMWTDERYTDPIANHEGFAPVPREDGATRGGARGRGGGRGGGCGGGRGRGQSNGGSSGNRRQSSNTRSNSRPASATSQSMETQ
jgi:hypothetical protein